MEGKKLIIVFVWAFFLMTTVMLYLKDFGTSFVGYLMFFFHSPGFQLRCGNPDTREGETWRRSSERSTRLKV